MATASLLAKLIREGVPESTAKRAAERAAAKQRAAEGGFSDEVFYHASKQDIDEFVPGYNDGLTFLTPNPEFANNWLGKGKFQERQGGTGSIEDVKKERKIFENQANETLESLPKDQQTQYFQDVLNAPLMQLRKNEQLADSAVYPVRTKVQKIFNPNKDWKEVRSFLEETQGYERNLTTDEYLKSGNYLQYENKEIRDFLESKGYDAMRLSESSDGVLDTLAVFNPRDIRSVNAQFDPAKRNSSKLLASAMGVGVLGTAALTPQDAEAKIISSLQALREGEIKAPKNDKTAQLAAAIRAGERAVKGSPAEFVYPSGLAPWLERIAYDEEPTKMETVMAIADFL